MANTSRSAALCVRVDVCNGGGSTESDQGRRGRVRAAAKGEVAAVRGCDSRRRREIGGRPQRGAAGTALLLPAAHRRCPSLPFDFAVRQAELTGHLFLLD